MNNEDDDENIDEITKLPLKNENNEMIFNSSPDDTINKEAGEEELSNKMENIDDNENLLEDTPSKIEKLQKSLELQKDEIIIGKNSIKKKGKRFLIYCVLIILNNNFYIKFYIYIL